MDSDVPNWSVNEATQFSKIVSAEAKAPPEKRPLFRPLPLAPNFPLDALSPLRDATIAIHQRTQAPIAVAAQSVLAAATLAVQAQRDVVLPGGGRKPLTAIFISVADSGERKSSVDRLALASVYRVEEEWRKNAEGERLAFMNAKEAWDAAREHVKRTKKGDMIALRAGLDAIGDAPRSPPHPMLLLADPTPEALTLHLAEGRPMAGVFTAEGGLLIGGAAFNDEARMRTAALFNTLWDGEAIRRRRVGTGISFLPGRRCSAHIMLQPVVAERLLGDAMFDGIGLTARMLIVAPDSTAGTRFYREVPETAAAALDYYGQRLRYLLLKPPITRTDMADVLDPPCLRLHPDAALAWVQFHDNCEAAISSDGPLASIRAFAAKLAEHAGRLAGVLTVYNDPDAMEVPLFAMQSGITLATFYANEMLRLHGGAAIAPELRLAQRLLMWWQMQPMDAVHLALIYQRGPAALRDAKTARRCVEILEEHGFVERLIPGIIIEGAPRKEAWRLRP
jgi:hypothetical protein